MTTYVALFRGINVGGNNILPMKVLVSLLQRIGMHNVKTYIQSGNAVFQSGDSDASKLAQKIRGAVAQECGFNPWVIILPSSELDKIVAENPFPEAISVPKSIHVYFLAHEPSTPDMTKLEEQRAETESYRLVGSVMYLHAPDGIGRSKLAAKMERLLGVPLTARNWRTVSKISEMACKTG